MMEFFKLVILLIIVILLIHKKTRVKFLMTVLILIILLFLTLCVRYESETGYKIYSISQKIDTENIELLSFNEKELFIILKKDISKNLFLKNIKIYINNSDTEIENIEVNRVFSDMEKEKVIRADKKEIFVYTFPFSKDTKEIFQKNFSKYKGTLKFVIIIEDKNKNENFKLIFNNVKGYYKKKGFSLFILSV